MAKVKFLQSVILVSLNDVLNKEDKFNIEDEDLLKLLVAQRMVEVIEETEPPAAQTTVTKKQLKKVADNA